MFVSKESLSDLLTQPFPPPEKEWNNDFKSFLTQWYIIYLWLSSPKQIQRQDYVIKKVDTDECLYRPVFPYRENWTRNKKLNNFFDIRSVPITFYRIKTYSVASSGLNYPFMKNQLFLEP